jgi:hypothetical protein
MTTRQDGIFFPALDRERICTDKPNTQPFLVSSRFFLLQEMAISTILQCFVADEEMFDGEQNYAENSLKTWMQKHGS